LYYIINIILKMGN